MSRRVALVALLVAGCAGLGVGDVFEPIPAGQAPSDAGTGSLAVEIGTGATAFVPLHDGDAVDVITGPQGGFHIWTSVRVAEPDLGLARVAVSLQFANGGAPAGPGVTVELPFTAVAGASEQDGLTNFVTDPDAVRGVHIVMRADVTTAAGRSGFAERDVVPR